MVAQACLAISAQRTTHDLIRVEDSGRDVSFCEALRSQLVGHFSSLFPTVGLDVDPCDASQWRTTEFLSSPESSRLDFSSVGLRGLTIGPHKP
jgi:hypothetical protein